jgi:GT2 family glycosyltransferase
VVDNDPETSAAATCAELGRLAQWPIVYVSESRRGIAFARNAGVRTALARGADLIAFIDDDEVPSPDWLDELLAVMREYDAPVVTGPVLPLFEGSASTWMVTGGLFDRPRHRTGRLLDRAGAGNVLLRTYVFSRLGRAFDEGLGLSGGEDTEFFLQATRAGFRIVWADTAIVHEWNPETRTRTASILRRSYSIGYSWAKFQDDLQPAFRIAIGTLTKGLVMLPFSIVQGRSGVVKSLKRIAFGIGFVMAKLGIRSEQYRATHGH